MQPGRAQPGPASSSESRTLSRANIKRRTSDRSRRAIAEPPESSDAPPTARRTLTKNSPQQGSSREMTPSEGIEVIKYTRTGRVSRANKGKRVHDCEECGKVRYFSFSGRNGSVQCVVVAITSDAFAAPGFTLNSSMASPTFFTSHASVHSSSGNLLTGL